MKILFIGGTVFLGRALVDEALRRGHEVTLFNRGQAGPTPSGAEAVRGDRGDEAALRALAEGRAWDCVIDTCGFEPRVVQRSVRALTGHVDVYAFVSSFHAYSDWPATGVDESSPRHACASDASPDDVPYNALKAGCERAVEEGFPARALIVNPGIIFGPGENVGRLPWWLETVAHGGRVLAPGSPDRAVQLIDARDIADFMLDRLAEGGTGRYLTTGVRGNTTMGELLGACVDATGAGTELVWADEQFLEDHGVAPWTEVPLWAPDIPEMAGIWASSSAKALAEGLRCRPVAETVADTWRALSEGGCPRPKYLQGKTPVGLSEDKHDTVLAAWDDRRSQATAQQRLPDASARQ
ncbi:MULTISPECIES: NAD-dependent epimerase/dehydratase family protein [unclassified Streptomyces]|uniref:NAD-dependent epimerase/dehydratase family protein n=1 Tax=unclassified Streptomyces TaxID=2593676 RepID=UPI002E2DD215|nr:MULTISPECIES: NAD-dependent epimerase/dehydratase family protein [unclassified Streptomyces]